MTQEGVSQLGYVIWYWRKERQLSQIALARKAGLSDRMISLLESGERSGMLFSTAVRLARALDVPLEMLAAALPVERTATPDPEPLRRTA